jgi:CheY-like chemotaxis protein
MPNVEEFGALTGLTLLVADDDDSIQRLCRNVISHYVPEAVVLTANDGAEAVAKARAHSPDIILMDIAKPGLDGLAAARVLKAAPETARIPIVAFTGQAWNPQGILDADCAALLTKPCDARKILTTVTEVLASRGVRARQ